MTPTSGPNAFIVILAMAGCSLHPLRAFAAVKQELSDPTGSVGEPLN
jgi:hypothetical protein